MLNIVRDLICSIKTDVRASFGHVRQVFYCMSRNSNILFSNERILLSCLLHKIVIRIRGVMSLKAFERWKMITGMENEIVMDIRTMHILSTLVEEHLYLF